jgi:hypothetical protein
MYCQTITNELQMILEGVPDSIHINKSHTPHKESIVVLNVT